MRKVVEATNDLNAETVLLVAVGLLVSAPIIRAVCDFINSAGSIELRTPFFSLEARKY